jgi:rare lipoprotein A
VDQYAADILIDDINRDVPSFILPQSSSKARPTKSDWNLKLKSALIALLAAATVFSSVELAAAQCGKASWYALNSRTASGERMNPAAMTAAHKTLKFGTKVRVTNARTGKSVIVRINDRGPFVRGRIIDLSKGAAKKIGMIGAGHAKVCVAKVG